MLDVYSLFYKQLKANPIMKKKINLKQQFSQNKMHPYFIFAWISSKRIILSMENILEKLIERRRNKILQQCNKNQSYCFFEFSSGISQVSQTINTYKPKSPNKKYMRSMKNSILKSQQKGTHQSHSQCIEDKNKSKQNNKRKRESKKKEDYKLADIHQQNLPRKFCLTSQRLRPSKKREKLDEQKNRTIQTTLDDIDALQNKQISIKNEENTKDKWEEFNVGPMEEDYLRSKIKQEIREKVQKKMKRRKSRESIHQQKMKKFYFQSCRITGTSTPNFSVYRY